MDMGKSITLTNDIPSKNSMDDHFDLDIIEPVYTQNDFDISPVTLQEETPAIQSRALKAKKSIILLDKRAQQFKDINNYKINFQKLKSNRRR